MAYWLMKSEPDVFGIDHLARRPKKTEPWTGVRNYQARNFMRDDMRVGDLALFYHSSCPQPGIAGVVKVSKSAYPDATQFDRNGDYYDPKASVENPRWFNVDVTLVRKTRLVALSELRAHPELQSLQILKRGTRLSITPVSASEWSLIESMF